MKRDRDLPCTPTELLEQLGVRASAATADELGLATPAELLDQLGVMTRSELTAEVLDTTERRPRN
ncbi:hypothetical protein O4159_12910 [Gordonia terrae]|uniref:hypothetical protein n=1 Tax=Gordonia hongkongensis TaxID=1701090 RepID=UPI0022B3B9CB|nr:hypothetical protein [Gordonia terrae]